MSSLGVHWPASPLCPSSLIVIYYYCRDFCTPLFQQLFALNQEFPILVLDCHCSALCVPCERIQHVKSQPAIPAIIIIIIIVRCDVFTQIVAFLINPFVVGFPRILPGVLLYFVVLLARIFVVVVIFLDICSLICPILSPRYRTSPITQGWFVYICLPRPPYGVSLIAPL